MAGDDRAALLAAGAPADADGREEELRRLVESVTVANRALEATKRELERRVRELERAQAALVQAGRLAAVGTLAAGVAHELNQPLTVIRGIAQILVAEPEPPPTWRADLELILRQTGRMARVVEHLRVFARATPAEPGPCDLNAVVRSALELFERQLAAHRITLHLELAEPLPLVRGDAQRLEQVVINLVANARDAMAEGGRLRIRTGVSHRLGRAGVRVTVADSGQGMPPEVAARIFDPFFTTKAVGEGMGLGLSISHGIVEEHGGNIALRSVVGKGSVFVVWLPSLSGESPG